ncbi:MAG: Holliday junction resolvase RuvX [Pseudomonadales bacterium]
MRATPDRDESITEGYVLAFDFGLRHIGVAAGQTVTGTASPLVTLRANHGKPDWQAVSQLVTEWRPVRLLVGLPLNMDDTDSAMSARATIFANQLQRRTGIAVDMVDERLTTRAAREQQPLRAHEQAAVLIAETWLNHRPPPGKRPNDD